MSRLLVLSLLASQALAANPLLGAYPTDQCDTCMDEVYSSCPGDYQTRSYATCMCAGDGSAKFVSCLSSCDPTLNEPANASATYYGYCLMFFKELCDGAQEFVDQETYEKQCSKKAIAEGGIGEKDGKSGDGDKTDAGSNDDKDAESDENTQIVKPTKTDEPASDKTSEASDANETDEATKTASSSATAALVTTTASGAKQTAIPAVALLAGLGLQLVNV